MNKTFVAELENHIVYLVNNNLLSFYINVLKEKDKTNISIDIKNKKKENIKDIITHYEKIDNYNITLVIPILKIEEDVNKFKEQCNTVSKIINTAYKFLTQNNIEVKENIKVIKHTNKSDFIDFFLKQFSNRVKHITLDDLVHEEVPYNKINAANISFVIGKPELELTINDEEMKEIIEETKYEVEIDKEMKVSPKKSFAAAQGFISYYLLGFLTAVITLLVLTLLVK